MSIFNLNIQNENTDNKIVAGLERLSQVFKTLLWEKAKDSGLSPIQIQILLFINYHQTAITTVSYIAKEFNITKPTVSDAVKVLEQKGLISKLAFSRDSRSYSIALTEAGQGITETMSDYTEPLTEIVSIIGEDDKEILWKHIISFITILNKTGIISVQRTCTACVHYSRKDGNPYCNLLKQELEVKDHRIDCPEFTPAQTG